MGRKSWTKTRINRSIKLGRKHHQMLLMGVEKVGKTALIKRFLEDTFTVDYKPTVEDNYNIDHTIKGCNLSLELVDMSGCYQFPAMRDLNIRKADMVMLVYENNNMKSLEEVKNINGIVKIARSDAIPTVVVGTKADLVSNGDEMQKVLDDFLEAYPDCTHLVTSAKDNVNVKEAFELLLISLLHKIRPNSLTEQSTGSKGKSGCGCVLL